ncbi:MAG: ribonuclease Z [Bacteroidales bacterium]
MKCSFISLGVASALPTIGRYPSAHVLCIHGRLFLIDCGESTQILLKKHGISLMKINNIFISHIHGDHIFGLFGLLSTMSLLHRETSINIYAPRDAADIIKFIKEKFGQGFLFEINHIITDSEEGVYKILDEDYLEVYSIPLQHRIPTRGYLFKEKSGELNIIKEKIEQYHLTIDEIKSLKKGKDIIRGHRDSNLGSSSESIVTTDLNLQILKSKEFCHKPKKLKSFAYCSDTKVFPELIEYVKGVDLLFHEATYADSEKEKAALHFHSTASQAAAIADQAEVKELVIGHYSSRYNDLSELLTESRKIFPNSFLAKEGLEFEF